MSTDLIKGLRMNCAPTGFRFAPTIDINVKKEQYDPKMPPERNEYVIKMTVMVKFSCTSAGYSRARENAEKQLVNFVYGGLISRVQAVRNAIFSGNAQEALSALDQLEQEYLR